MRILSLNECREHSDEFLFLPLKFHAQLFHNTRIYRAVDVDGWIEGDTHTPA